MDAGRYLWQPLFVMEIGVDNLQQQSCLSEEAEVAASRTILVADDDAQSSDSLQKAFGKESPKTQLVFVRDGMEVMEYLQRQPPFEKEDCPTPALLLLKPKLPVMDGFQVLQWLEAIRDFRPPHVVMLTASLEDENRQLARVLGADSCLVSARTAQDFSRQAQELAAMLAHDLD